jgi:hypothetical protein
LAYRRHEAARVEASNAMMGLLVGANMSAHMLRLNAGSKHMIEEIFPQVPHIVRFSMTPDVACGILRDAESHLGGMAVPYALAIHEDFLRTCLDLLLRAGRCTSRNTRRPGLKEIHARIEQATGQTFDATAIAQFQMMRCLRNAIVHANGRAGRELADEFLPRWSSDADRGWVRFAKRSPKNLREDDVVDLRHGELLMALIVTKNLARQANRMLIDALPRQMWADLLVEDESASVGLDGNHIRRERKLRSLARRHYEALALTRAEIAEALDRMDGRE